MTHVLKNEHLEIEIDLPLGKYNFSRFDWTGKIVLVKYKNICVSGVEKIPDEDDTQSGKGFYNEFGIDAALGYAETKAGEWFHKIGIGLLKKEDEGYLFCRKYAIEPADFKVTAKQDEMIVNCISPVCNGYSYVLKKEISLVDDGFIIKYFLKNTGEKAIHTDEYNHNFIAINNELIGNDYLLKFPFCIKPAQFGETVNLERKVDIGEKEFTFNGTPNEPFFFSNLSGNENVESSWELINTKTKIGISEKGSFKTNKVNLWGWKHVISPELFFAISVAPGKEIEWSRTYRIFEIA
jgi:hypothetical protein